jgi:hypothetical protein
MKIVQLALIAALFAAGGFLLHRSATTVPLVSDLEVISGTVAALSEDGNYDGIPGNDGLEIRLHQHDATFRYYSAQPGDYANLKRQLAVGDRLIIWAQPPQLVHWHGIWFVQKDNEVLRSFGEVRASHRAPVIFFFSGLGLLWCGLMVLYMTYRQSIAASMRMYRLAHGSGAHAGLRSLL